MTTPLESVLNLAPRSSAWLPSSLETPGGIGNKLNCQSADELIAGL